MSLLQAKKDNIGFEYSLPLNFEKQLEFIDNFKDCFPNGLIKLSSVWNLIKDNITIFEYNAGKEVLIYDKGCLSDEKHQSKMLSLSYKISILFAEKVNAFMKEQGVIN